MFQCVILQSHVSVCYVTVTCFSVLYYSHMFQCVILQSHVSVCYISVTCFSVLYYSHMFQCVMLSLFIEVYGIKMGKLYFYLHKL